MPGLQVASKRTFLSFSLIFPVAEVRLTGPYSPRLSFVPSSRKVMFVCLFVYFLFFSQLPGLFKDERDQNPSDISLVAPVNPPHLFL